MIRCLLIGLFLLQSPFAFSLFGGKCKKEYGFEQLLKCASALHTLGSEPKESRVQFYGGFDSTFYQMDLMKSCTSGSERPYLPRNGLMGAKKEITSANRHAYVIPRSIGAGKEQLVVIIKGHKGCFHPRTKEFTKGPADRGTSVLVQKIHCNKSGVNHDRWHRVVTKVPLNQTLAELGGAKIESIHADRKEGEYAKVQEVVATEDVYQETIMDIIVKDMNFLIAMDDKNNRMLSEKKWPAIVNDCDPQKIKKEFGYDKTTNRFSDVYAENFRAKTGHKLFQTFDEAYSYVESLTRRQGPVKRSGPRGRKAKK